MCSPPPDLAPFEGGSGRVQSRRPVAVAVEAVVVYAVFQKHAEQATANARVLVEEGAAEGKLEKTVLRDQHGSRRPHLFPGVLRDRTQGHKRDAQKGRRASQSGLGRDDVRHRRQDARVQVD